MPAFLVPLAAAALAAPQRQAFQAAKTQIDGDLFGLSGRDVDVSLGFLSRMRRGISKLGKKGLRLAVATNPVTVSFKLAAMATGPIRRRIFRAFFRKLIARRARYLAWTKRRTLKPTKQEIGQAREWAYAYVAKTGIFGKITAAALHGELGAAPRKVCANNFCWSQLADGSQAIVLRVGKRRLVLALSPADVQAIDKLLASYHRQLHAHSEVGTRLEARKMYLALASLPILAALASRVLERWRKPAAGTLGAEPVTSTLITASIPLLIALAKRALLRAEKQGAPRDPRLVSYAPAIEAAFPDASAAFKASMPEIFGPEKHGDPYAGTLGEFFSARVERFVPVDTGVSEYELPLG